MSTPWILLLYLFVGVSRTVTTLLGLAKGVGCSLAFLPGAPAALSDQVPIMVPPSVYRLVGLSMPEWLSGALQRV